MLDHTHGLEALDCRVSCFHLWQPCVGRIPRLSAPWSASMMLLSGMLFFGTTGGVESSARRLYPGLTGTGVSGARDVGRPKYLMS